VERSWLVRFALGNDHGRDTWLFVYTGPAGGSSFEPKSALFFLFFFFFFLGRRRADPGPGLPRQANDPFHKNTYFTMPVDCCNDEQITSPERTRTLTMVFVRDRDEFAGACIRGLVRFVGAQKPAGRSSGV